jgi:putative transposase
MIGKFEPSSNICHFCGYHNSDLTLKDRELNVQIARQNMIKTLILQLTSKNSLSLSKSNYNLNPWKVGICLGTCSLKRKE